MSFSAIDTSGRPTAAGEWSISAPVAEMSVENGEAVIQGERAGRAVLTVTEGNLSATAIITVLSAQRLPAGTVRWSVEPTPGFETLIVRPALQISESEVNFYSIEWSKNSNAIVRAFRDSGQQLWMTQLNSSASPLTLKQTLPDMGALFLNGTPVSDFSKLLIGNNGGVMSNFSNATLPGLPIDGRTIVLRECGGDSGDLILLERGRFRDSLVSLSPIDGSEAWRYNSEGRLNKNWTVDFQGDVGIAETIPNPISSAFLIVSGKNGELRYRIPFPESSSTINGFRCKDPIRNVLENVRPSRAGAVFTNADGNMYLQIETHVESVDLEACEGKQYSFDDSLALLRVSPEGESLWKTFQHIHADGNGGFVVQPRVFAGESIPDGLGGVLAAWTYAFPGNKEGKKPYFEARLSRISDTDQSDFTLPMPLWTSGITSLFDENMILGEGDILYATNKHLLLRFHIPAGEVNWVRQPPTGEVDLQFAARGGGLVVSNAGRLFYFDPDGNGQPLPSTVVVSNPNDIGLAQFDLFDHIPLLPLQLRTVQIYQPDFFLAVEDGAPDGRGSIVFFVAQ